MCENTLQEIGRIGSNIGALAEVSGGYNYDGYVLADVLRTLIDAEKRLNEVVKYPEPVSPEIE